VRTEELVSMLANRAEAADISLVARRCATAVIGATFVSALLMSALLGVRSTLVRDLAVPMFWIKEASCAALSVFGLMAAARLGRPGHRLGLVRAGLVAPAIAIWALATTALLAADPAQRKELLFGQTAAVCPFLIALLSIPVFIALFWAMKQFAPTRLRAAGAAAGFAAGALGALVYSLHCAELAAPFLGAWYALGILIPTATGAVLGPPLLRW
jgi:hypothetical protein